MYFFYGQSMYDRENRQIDSMKVYFWEDFTLKSYFEYQPQ